MRATDEHPGANIGGPSSPVLRQHDYTLGGIAVNDTPAVELGGRTVATLVHLACTGCGATVGLVRYVLPTDRDKGLLIADVQGVFDAAARPVGTRVVTFRVRADQSILADCAAHGRIEFDAMKARLLARQVANATHNRKVPTARLRGRPLGQPVGFDLTPGGRKMTREQARAARARARSGEGVRDIRQANTPTP